jgi:hypothetical protein
MKKPTKKKPVDQVVSLRLSADVHRVITLMAEEEGRTFGAMARVLIHQGLWTYPGKGPSASNLRKNIDSTLWRFAHPKEHERNLNKPVSKREQEEARRRLDAEVL